jgi:phage baseplate assembly protein V
MNGRLPHRESPAFRVGIVAAQDLAGARVRVNFPDRDNLLSWWLPIAAPKTQDDKFYWMPDLGEQVVCLMDAHDENGAVLGAIYSQADATPVESADKFHATFKDGAVIEYDRAAHALTVTLPASGTINLNGPGAVTIQSATQIVIQQGAAEISLVGGQVQVTPPPIVYAQAVLQ